MKNDSKGKIYLTRGGVRLGKETQFDNFCRVIVHSWYFCIDTTFLMELND